jgi:hypothetical protein
VMTDLVLGSAVLRTAFVGARRSGTYGKSAATPRVLAATLLVIVSVAVNTNTADSSDWLKLKTADRRAMHAPGRARAVARFSGWVTLPAYVRRSGVE